MTARGSTRGRPRASHDGRRTHLPNGVLGRRDVTDALFALLIVLLLAAVLLAAGTAVAADREDCRLQKRSVVIDLRDDYHRPVLRHVWAAIRAGEVARLHVARDGVDGRRRDALRGIPTKPGYDRDEYPPAVSREGGEGTHVRYIRSSVNRSAGATMGDQLEGFCSGQSFRFERPSGR